MAFPDLIAAGVTDEGSSLPFELFAGDVPVTTQVFPGAAADIAILVPVVINSSGAVAAWNGTDYPGGGEATMVPMPIGITAAPFDHTTGERVQVYTGGAFNMAAIAWPGGANTDAKKRAAFVGTRIQVIKLGSQAPFSAESP